jgi:hypothetical protein
VLYDFPVLIQPEDIDTGVALVSGPFLKAMQNYESALCNRTLKMDSLARILIGHLLKVPDERFLPITDSRIVLDVNIAGVKLHGLGWSA